MKHLIPLLLLSAFPALLSAEIFDAASGANLSIRS